MNELVRSARAQDRGAEGRRRGVGGSSCVSGGIRLQTEGRSHWCRLVLVAERGSDAERHALTSTLCSPSRSVWKICLRELSLVYNGIRGITNCFWRHRLDRSWNVCNCEYCSSASILTFRDTGILALYWNMTIMLLRCISTLVRYLRSWSIKRKKRNTIGVCNTQY